MSFRCARSNTHSFHKHRPQLDLPTTEYSAWCQVTWSALEPHWAQTWKVYIKGALRVVLEPTGPLLSAVEGSFWAGQANPQRASCLCYLMN